MSRQCQQQQEEAESFSDKLAKVPTKMVRVQDNSVTIFVVNNQNSKENEREPESFNSIALSDFQMQNGPMVRNSGKQVPTKPACF